MIGPSHRGGAVVARSISHAAPRGQSSAVILGRGQGLKEKSLGITGLDGLDALEAATAGLPEMELVFRGARTVRQAKAARPAKTDGSAFRLAPSKPVV